MGERGEETERHRREHDELLQELRALIPGAEVLFGFLLAIRFTGQFGDLTTEQVYVYYGTIVATAFALLMFFAPAAYHRIQFREHDKERMLVKGNQEAILGTVLMALAFAGVLFLVTDLLFSRLAAWLAAGVFVGVAIWRWWAIALWRRFGAG